jgi:HEAT repeat protein
MKRRTAVFPFRKRSSGQLVRIALRGWGGDRCWRAIPELQMRGSPETLKLAQSLAGSSSWRRRALGLYIASQLRQRSPDARFGSVEFAVEETQRLLLAGLHDRHVEVVRAAVSGLGHRPHAAALADLVRLADHSDTDLRQDVAVVLGHYPEPHAITALLRLARDADDDTRDWATFGLGSMQEADTPDIRALLWQNLRDPNPTVQNEALIGLAERGDARALEHLLAHLDDDCRVYELEAAEKLADPRLLAALQALWVGAGRDSGVNGSWLGALCAAIEACGAAPVGA